ncbi:hypothetical protein M917_1825 [Psychrobacter aquaticus CMS 56]|uniref:Uncharacterized protein n=1 Tax=Psychrobacter aquaticus CMS 56 TaxID=1354303 RepID=U4T552_9GAMM|nr:hypothetical protein M917_1825 [Psychrobacter aquaticus CMS 56]
MPFTNDNRIILKLFNIIRTKKIEKNIMRTKPTLVLMVIALHKL